MRKTALNPAVLISMLTLLAGCAARPPAYVGLYEALSEDPATRDSAVLTGRRIVIDPGHGGAFRGTAGPDSLTEAEVNLGVALYLWGLLEDAGAEVLLTRATDRDFLPAGSSAVADDLAARMQRANDFAPEVFLSIHHNACASGDGARNAVEVYYRGDDPGASLELATDLHTHLARNLGIDETRIRPGNYFVLRNSTAAASVLGEASYLTHPGVEQRLKLAAKHKLEAEAYFMGLIRYFTRGVPVLARVAPAPDTLRAPGTLAFTITPAWGVPVDPASIEATVGRRRIRPVLLAAADTVAFDLPADLPNGPHQVSVSARSVRQATAVVGPFTVVIDRPPAFILPLAPSEADTAGNHSLAILVLDGDGRPVADGTPVAVGGPGAATRSLRTRGGRASFSTKTESPQGPWRVSAGAVSQSVSFDQPPAGAGPLHIAVDAGSNRPLPAVTALLGASRHAAADADGLVRLARGDPAPTCFKAPGYRYVFPPPTAGFGRIVRLEPLFGGLLHGVRIALDPGGGGPDDAGRGAGALRGASVNLRVARNLEQILAAAGAAPLLVRAGDEPLSLHERIHRINAFGSDMALQVRFGAADAQRGDACQVQHFPGSMRGAALAGGIADASSGLPPCLSVTGSASADLFLQQTACPAIVLSAGSLADPGTETLFESARWNALQAQALLRGILGYLGGEAYRPARFEVRVATEAGEPIAGAAVTIDDTLTLLTGGDGSALFTVFNPGIHGCLVAAPDGRQRLLEIEAADGVSIDCILP